MQQRLNSEQGIALVIAVMSMMLMTALGTALVLTTMTETGISSTFVEGIEVFYAADAAVERTLSDLPATADWNALVGLYSDSGTASRIRVVLSVAAADVEPAIVVRAQAYGSRGVERTVEATVVRTDEVGPASVRLLAWRELR